jgi:methylmalonyl-CoA/ethylmalonyl-CoA epimerase
VDTPEGLTVGSLDHVGVAVASLEAAAATWRLLGLDVGPPEEVAGSGVRVAFVTIGGARVELLEPLAADTPVGRFLSRRGPGLHHVAWRVDDLEDALARLAAAGVPLVDAAPRPGAHGSRVAFLHPTAVGGVLVELVEPVPPRDSGPPEGSGREEP